MKPGRHCFTIPADLPFLKTLAAWALERHGDRPETLSRVWVLLPSRRACRALRDVFLDLSGGRPLLLPRIRPIGDLDENDLPPDLLVSAALPDLPPAVAPERRLLLLTRLVMRFGLKQGVHSPAQAVELARQLARFLDGMEQESLDPQRLESLAGDMQEHWKQILDFLGIVLREWPKVLAEEGAMDAVNRRNRWLTALVKHWQAAPPDAPVIAAGSTGTQPATAELLAAITRLPQGAVVLPGLDQAMSDAEWKAVGATHPQYPLKTLLERLGVARRDVRLLSETKESARVQCLRAVFQPPPATAGWAGQTLPLDGMKHMQLCEADTPLDEARVIAAALREALETPARTAALVTHDRRLARMVAAQMERFEVAIDDSAGKPLLEMPAGIFLRLVTEAAVSRASPVALLALLRHPLAAAGTDAKECRRLSGVLDKKLLRGVRLASGWRALRGEAVGEEPALLRLIEGMEREMRTFSTWLAKDTHVPAVELMQEHMRLAEWLAATATESGAERLWAGDDGNQLAAALAKIAAHADAMPDIAAAAYPAWFEAMLAAETFRPHFGQHPRLHILSPLEARLLQYDFVILGGLNEKSWPEHPAADPWMSRPMRAAFGLPPLERAIGQSAHDFFMLAAAARVLLTRSRKVDGTPAIPSRWLVRMKTLIQGKDEALFSALADSGHYARAVEVMEMPDGDLPPLERPAPRPPLSARPKEISVSDFDLWQRDPYALYAKRVLGLKALDPLDQDPDTAEFGSAVHEACHIFARKWPQHLPENPYEELLAAGRAAFTKYENRPAVIALWWPRFEVMAAWLAAREQERRAPGIIVQSEREMRWQATPEFAVKGRVDRIETDASAAAVIVDYKTGTPPSPKKTEEGEANQLQLEALMMLENARARSITGLEYWKLSGQAGHSAIKPLEKPEALIAACRRRFFTLIEEYGNPEKTFAAQDNPSLRRHHNDYEHLTRTKEWGEV